MEVIVVGAGPSGCIAAASAAEEEHNVAIYEEHKKIGYPEKCGGLLSKRAVDWFDSLGINLRKSIVNRINGAVINYGNKFIEINWKKTNAFVIDRSAFDQECADFAERNGVKFVNKKIGERDLSNQKSLIIGADGPFSVVARTFNFPKIKLAVAYQCELDGLNLDKSRVQMFLFDSSFGWIIPKNEESARVGIAFFNGADIEKYHGFVKRIRERLGGSRMAGFFCDCIPAEVRPLIQKDNVYLVGDAAGQVKATSLGGIYYGCSSAWLAGKCVEGMDYEKRWKKEIGGRLFLHSIARSFLNSPSFVNIFFDSLKMLRLDPILSGYDMEEIKLTK